MSERQESYHVDGDDYTYPASVGGNSAHNQQRAVFGAVQARGYVDGWTPEQLLARQVCKLQEELGEACEMVQLPEMDDFDLNDKISDTSACAYMVFKDHPFGDYVGKIQDVNILKSELVDMLVVLCVAAGAIEALTGQPFDILAEAYKKATSDVARGVRK